MSRVLRVAFLENYVNLCKITYLCNYTMYYSIIHYKLNNIYYTGIKRSELRVSYIVYQSAKLFRPPEEPGDVNTNTRAAANSRVIAASLGVRHSDKRFTFKNLTEPVQIVFRPLYVSVSVVLYFFKLAHSS